MKALVRFAMATERRLCVVVTMAMLSVTTATGELADASLSVVTNVQSLIQSVCAGMEATDEYREMGKAWAQFPGMPDERDEAAMAPWLERRESLEKKYSEVSLRFPSGWKCIYRLGELRAKEASGFLAQVARSGADWEYRSRALRAVIEIGDTNLVDFAREALTGEIGESDPNNRLAVFQGLAPYVGVNVRGLKPTAVLGQTETDEQTRVQVLRFFLDVATSRPTYGWEGMIDEIVCLASPDWKNSVEREAWLYKSSGEGYWGEQLRAIRALPASERTHVEVHPLRGPAPSLSVTNGPLAPAVEAILKETPSPSPPSAVTNAP